MDTSLTKTTGTPIKEYRLPTCENAKVLHSDVGYPPQCWCNKAIYSMTIITPKGEVQVVFVCQECADHITEDVLRNDCTVNLQPIERAGAVL